MNCLFCFYGFRSTLFYNSNFSAHVRNLVKRPSSEGGDFVGSTPTVGTNTLRGGAERWRAQLTVNQPHYQ